MQRNSGDGRVEGKSMGVIAGYQSWARQRSNRSLAQSSPPVTSTPQIQQGKQWHCEMGGFHKNLPVSYLFSALWASRVEINEKFYGILFKYKISIVHTSLWNYRGGMWKKEISGLRDQYSGEENQNPLTSILIVVIEIIKILQIFLKEKNPCRVWEHELCFALLIYIWKALGQHARRWGFCSFSCKHASRKKTPKHFQVFKAYISQELAWGF